MRNKVVLVLLITFLLSAFSGCGGESYRKDNKIVLDKNNIEQINVTLNKSKITQPINIEDAQQISTIVDYLKSLELSENKMYAEDYAGLSYDFWIHYKDKSKDYFILGDDGLYPLLIKIREEIEINKGTKSIDGVIVSTKGIDKVISCEVKDKNGEQYNLIVESAQIIDFKGTYAPTLKEKDVIKAFLSNGFVNDKSVYLPTSQVYIHSSATD